MSRSTGPNGPGADGGSGRPRRRRRAGRGRGDFRETFGAAASGEVPDNARLREPRATDRYVRGRTRLTVRELMEQMNAEAQAPAGSDPAATPSGFIPPESMPSNPQRPTPAAADGAARKAPAGNDRPGTEETDPAASVPPASPEPSSDAAAPGTPRPPATSEPSPDSTTPATSGPSPDERPTVVHRFDNEATQKIPTVSDGPAPDLSDRATTARVVEESRSQGPAAPLQPTPDLTDRIPVVTDGADRPGPRRHSGRLARARRRRSLTRNATATGRILVTVACVMALVGTGFVWGYLQSWDGNWRTINAVDPDDENIRNKEAQYGDETYLIVGTDTRAGQNANVGAGSTADADGARSDTVILVNIPANRSRVVAVSFPRDLQVDRPECQEWDNATGEYGAMLQPGYGVKLNSVYAEGGPQCLVRVLTEMSGLNINHFIAMDFYGFEKVVRAIGGVEVCSTAPLYDYELGQILRRAGTQTLTGRRALNYVRARTVASEGNGDYGRIKRQQLFMSSLLRSTLSGNVLGNPAKLNSMVNTFIEYSYVDGVDTESLLNLAESMQGIEAGRVTFLTIPTSGTTTDGSNNEIPRTEDIDAIFNAIIDDQPLPGEQAEADAEAESENAEDTPSDTPDAPAATPTSPQAPTEVQATAQNPGNVGVRVLNGTGQGGLAGEASDQLTPYGFDVRGIADASEPHDTTVVRYGPGQEDAAATVAAMFPGAAIQPDSTVKSGVEVILGTDFTGEMGEVPSSGATITVTKLAPAVKPNNLPNDLAITNAGDTTCS